MVTSHNSALVQELVARLASNYLIRIVPTLDETPAAAIIANAARSHGETAQQLIVQGAHLLIEKPVVLTSQEAEHLVTLARQAMRVVLPGLSYRFCSYLHHFAQQIAALESVSGFDLHWSDPAGEMRYGEQKPYDASITVADDVMPHIWTILSVIFPGTTFTTANCKATRGGKAAAFTLAGGGMKGTVTIERDSDQRRRLIRLRAGAAEPASLDFAVEPGVMTVGTHCGTADANWTTRPRPLARQFRYFMECVAQGRAAESDQTALIESVRFSESTSALLSRCLDAA